MRSIGEWIKYLLSPAQSPYVRDFPEPLCLPEPDAPQVFRSSWSLRTALRGEGGKVDEGTRIVRRRFARYLFNEVTRGPAKEVKTWTNAGGYVVQEYMSLECSEGEAA